MLKKLRRLHCRMNVAPGVVRSQGKEYRRFPSSKNNLRFQTASCAPLLRARYSYSVEERDTVSCRLPSHVMAPEPIMNRRPVLFLNTHLAVMGEVLGGRETKSQVPFFVMECISSCIAANRPES